jgi:hypothetical protein
MQNFRTTGRGSSSAIKTPHTLGLYRAPPVFLQPPWITHVRAAASSLCEYLLISCQSPIQPAKIRRDPNAARPRLLPGLGSGPHYGYRCWP